MTTTPTRSKVGVLTAVLALVLSVLAIYPGTSAGAQAPGDYTGQLAGKSTKVKTGSANFAALVISADADGVSSKECHGALISPTWVLANASCNSPTAGENLFVFIGATNFAKNKQNDFELKAIVESDVVEHPLVGDRWALRAYDMALYKLDSPSTRRPAVVGAIPGKQATVYDYGPTTTNGKNDGVLRKGTATIVNNKSMLEVLKALHSDYADAPLDHLMMQRQAPGNEAKPCLSAGAPLVASVDGVPTLVGLGNIIAIVSSNNTADACGLAIEEYIHFYSRLSGKTTADWIAKTVGKTGPTKDKRCRGKLATIFGTNASETILGTSGNDVIFADRGRDIVKGGKGNDRLCGGGGPDTLVGGQGKRDVCDGGKGNNTAAGSCETKKNS